MTESTTQDLELVHANPVDLVLDVNVRTIIDLDAEFLNSIREHGVLQPPTGWRDKEGVIFIEIGQRRSLAAAQLKLPTIPVIVKPRVDVEAEKLLTQLVENDRRQGLRDSEHAAAYQQLTLFGLKPDDIAKRTGTKRDTVRAAVKILKERPEALEVMKEHPVTLDVAAQLLEFEAHPDLLEQISAVIAVEPGKLAHEIAAARHEVEKRLLRDTEIAQLVSEGVRYLSDDDLPSPADWEALADLEEVFVPGESNTRPLSAEEALPRGGLSATLYWGQDWVSGTGWVWGWKREYYVTEPRSHGYVPSDEFEEQEYADERTPEEVAEAERREQEAQRIRDEKAEQDRLWVLAALVRREWVRDTLLHPQRKLPAGAGMVVLDIYLGDGGGALDRVDNYADAAEAAAGLLGVVGDAAKVPTPGFWAEASKLAKLQVFRDLAQGLGHERVLLALALGRAETHLDRRPASSSYSEQAQWFKYLRLLESWGYTLATVEQELVDTHQAGLDAATAADADDDLDDDSSEDDFDDDTDEDDVDDADED